MRNHSDDPLDTALAGLERPRASRGFTRAVLARLDEAPAPASGLGRVPAWAWAGLATALLAVAVLAVVAPAIRPPRTDLTAEAGELRRRHQELRRDLEALQALSEASAPVLVLDSRPDYDLVLDLRTVLDEAATARPGARPAADTRQRRP